MKGEYKKKMNRIVSANFIKGSGSDDPTEVEVTFEDGSKKLAFNYREDIISVTEGEIIGLTMNEVERLLRIKLHDRVTRDFFIETINKLLS